MIHSASDSLGKLKYMVCLKWEQNLCLLGSHLCLGLVTESECRQKYYHSSQM